MPRIMALVVEINNRRQKFLAQLCKRRTVDFRTENLRLVDQNSDGKRADVGPIPRSPW